MQLLVNREPSSAKATLGILYIDGVAECDTLEDVIREIEGEPVESWKIYGETAIPQGTYKITSEESPRFGPNTLSVNDVPGFDKIRIHGGNTDVDTHGCLLVGVRTGPDFVGHSQTTLAQLKIKVLTALRNGEEVTITYRNPE